MADGSIILDARLNKKGAEADLKALQAKAKSTAQQIAAVDKQLGSAQTKRSTLADSLESARQKAAETAAALDEVNNQIDAAERMHLQSIKIEYPGISDASVQDILKSRMQGEVELTGQQSKLLSTLGGQEAILNKAASDYQIQNDAVQSLQQQHDVLTAQLEQENQVIERQQDLIQYLSGDESIQDYFSKQADAIEAAFAKIESRMNKAYGAAENAATQRAEHAVRIVEDTKKALAAQDEIAAQQPVSAPQIDSGVSADRIRAAADAAGALAEELTRAALTSGTLQKALHTVGAVGQKVFSAVGSRVQAIRSRLDQAAKGAAQFRNRLMSLVTGALVFNVLSSGLRTLTSWMGTALLSSSQLRAALGNLQGAASTAAAPLLSVLVPALTALANAAAMVFSYIARLVAFFTGKTISASASAAKAMAGVGKAAGGTAKKVKDANGELAAFDELNVLNKKSDEDNGGSGGGGGSAGDIVPDYDFTAESPFLDSILDAVEAGDWYKVGQLLGEKLRDSLNAIPWPDIQDKAVQWATNLATMLNGIVETPGLWDAIGHTLAQGLNTALLFYDTFMQTFHWASLGAGLAAGLTQAIAEIQWDTLGRALADGMRAAILTLYNFTMTFTGWADLGNGIAACLNAAINNIPWQEAAVGMSKLVIGLLNTLIAAVQGTDWTTFGQNVVGMIGSLDWAGLFAALSTLSVAVLTAINDILGQVDWAAVGTTLVGCLQAIDWAGLLTQAGTFIANSWPVMLAALAASLLPQLGAFILGTVLPSLVGHLVTLGATLLGQAVTWLTGTLLPAIMSGLSALITAIVGAIGLWPAVLLAVLAVLAAAIIAYLVTHWEEIKQKFSETCEMLTEKMRSAGESLKAIWNAFWLMVKLIGMQIWENITTAWSDFWQGLHRLLNSAGAALQSAWSSAWTALGNTVKKIWDGIVGTIKTAVNSVISLVNGMISAVVGGVNAVIGVLNGFSFDVPEFAQGALGTAKIGFNIDPITAPQIPYLAQGAVIPANHEFLAVLGDQTNGTNVEAPLETIQEALAEVLAAQGGQEITIRFAGDLAQLVRLLNPYIDKENNRRGARLVSGGVY